MSTHNRFTRSKWLSHVSNGAFERSGSLRPNPENQLLAKEANRAYDSMDDIDLMIKNGWGDTPKNKLPEDWRTRRK